MLAVQVGMDALACHSVMAPAVWIVVEGNCLGGVVTLCQLPCRATLGSGLVEDEGDLPAFAADLVRVVAEKAEVHFSS